MKLEDVKITEIDFVDIERGKYQKEFGRSYANLFKGNKKVSDYYRTFGKYTELDNGKYNLMCHAHVSLLCNVAIDISLFDLERGDAKVPDIRDGLKPGAKLFGTFGETVIFTSDGVVGTAVSLQYVVDVIKTFGIPTEIYCGDDYPIIFKFGDIEFLLAPRIENSDKACEAYKFDFEKWCPQIYGNTFSNLTMAQLMDLICSMPKDTNIEDLQIRIHNMSVKKQRTENVEEFF